MKKNLVMTLAVACLSLGLRAAPEPVEVPDFTLARIGSGPAFRLKEARGEFVVLHFLLKTECPLCLRHTRTYLQRAGEWTGVRQVFVKPDSEAEIRQWARDLPAEAPIYRDPEAALAKRMKIPDGYAFHGQTVHYPALVLIDPQGREVFRHVGRSNADRVDFDVLARKIRELRNPTR